MEEYSVVFDKKAGKELSKLPKEMRERIFKKVMDTKKNPFETLKNKSAEGEWVTFHKKDDKKCKYRGICVAEVVVISNDYGHRLQKIIWCQEKKNSKSKWKDLKKSQLYSTVRACYYVINSDRNKVVFGQFCMNSYPEVVGKLFKKAHKKGFFKKMTPNQMLKELNRFKPKAL